METHQHSRLNFTINHYFDWRLVFTIINLHSKEGWKSCQTHQAWLIYISINTASFIILYEYTLIHIYEYTARPSFQKQVLSFNHYPHVDTPCSKINFTEIQWGFFLLYYEHITCINRNTFTKNNKCLTNKSKQKSLLLLYLLNSQQMKRLNI